MKESIWIQRNDWREWYLSFHPAGDYSLVIQPQTFTQLWHEIQKRDNPGVGKTTVRRHLDKMVAEHVLVKRTKTGRDPKTKRRYNKTPYGLHPKKWLLYLIYLLTILQRLDPDSQHLFMQRFGASLSTNFKPLAPEIA